MSSVSDHKAPGVNVDKVCLSLGGRPILSQLSMRFVAGQWHCVLGRSGVGKSSLLRLLAGLQQPDSGRISADNGVALGTQLAFMSQDDGLLPWLTALDNVQLGARLRGGSNVESAQRAEALLDKVNLLSWKDKLPASLSGGMRQRVALARTLFEHRAVVLMDEPFSRLDAVTRDELQTLAFTLLESRTVVLVTHDPLEALRLGHSVTVLQAAESSRLLSWWPSQAPLRDMNDTAHHELLPALWDALRESSTLQLALNGSVALQDESL